MSAIKNKWVGADRRKDYTTRAIRDLQTQFSTVTTRIDERLTEGTARMDSQDKAIQANTELTQSIKTDVSSVVEIFNAMKGLMKVLDVLGKFAKPIGYIVGAASACVVLWGRVKGGDWSPHK